MLNSEYCCDYNVTINWICFCCWKVVLHNFVEWILIIKHINECYYWNKSTNTPKNRPIFPYVFKTHRIKIINQQQRVYFSNSFISTDPESNATCLRRLCVIFILLFASLRYLISGLRLKSLPHKCGFMPFEWVYAISDTTDGRCISCVSVNKKNISKIRRVFHWSSAHQANNKAQC